MRGVVWCGVAFVVEANQYPLRYVMLCNVMLGYLGIESNRMTYYILEGGERETIPYCTNRKGKPNQSINESNHSSAFNAEECSVIGFVSYRS